MNFQSTSYLLALNPKLLEVLNKQQEEFKAIPDHQGNIIELDNVTTIYEGERIPTIQNVCLKIRGGEVIFIIGPNGAGKTTLLETICGILPIREGTAKVFGLSVKKNGNQIRKRIGYVLQEIDFDPSEPFLVKDVVMIGRTGLIGVGKRVKERDWAIVRASLEAVGMVDFWARPIGKLSAGQQQKVMIASALAGEPALLLLDEPFANLDINARHEIYQLLLNLNRKANVTILCVSHNLGIPPEADRVILMQQGRIFLNNERTQALESPLYKAFVELSSTETKPPLLSNRKAGEIVQED